MISATVAGHLGRDAETRAVGSTTVTSFSVASSGFRNKEKVTDWVSVSFWGDRGPKLEQYLTKGASIIARGTMWIREYDGKDGTRKFSLELRADDIELVGGKSGEQREQRGPGERKTSTRKAADPPPDDFGGAGDDSDVPF